MRRWQGLVLCVLAALPAVALADDDTAALDAARALAEAGALGEAARAYEALAASTRPAETRRLALDALVPIHLDAGHIAEALRAAERLIEVTRAQSDPSVLAAVLYRAATAYGAAGDRVREEALVREAVEVAAKADDHARLRGALTTLAVLLANRGATDESRAVVEQLASVSEGDEFATATAHHLLGFLDSQDATRLRAQGETELAQAADARAIERLRQARAAYAADGDRSQLVHVLKLIGDYHMRQGDLASAVAAADEALEEAKAHGLPRELIMAHLQRGRLAGAEAKLDDALAHFRAAVELGLSLYRALGETIATGEREFLASAFRMAGNAIQLSGDVDAATFFMEARRAQSLLEMLASGDAVRDVRIPPELERAERAARLQVARTARAYEDAARTGSRSARREARDALDAAHEQLERIVDRVRREAKAAAAVVYPRPATPDELQAVLEPDEALVVYEVQSSVLRALVVTAEETRLATLGLAAWVRPHVDRLLLPKKPWVDPAAARSLTGRIVAPLRLPTTVRRLYVAPAGRLAYVPFALIAPELEVVYVPSGTALRLLEERPARRGAGVLGLGDPLYGDAPPAAADTTRAFSRKRLTRLPATRDEVKAIADVSLLGAEATEAGLRAALARPKPWRAVHLACHGLLDTERPMLSALALSPGPDDDGFLDVKDVLRLDVPTELVVLSACETGRGRLHASEGVIGLTRAFLGSGANSVLCSLWKVDDAATQALMARFYELWNPEHAQRGEGLGAAAALRAAQAFVRDHPDHDWSHPYYWAAWVLWGLP